MPPVASKVGDGEPAAASSAMRASRICPIIPAKPRAQPARIASAVDFPTAAPARIAAGSSRGSRAVRPCR